MSAWGSIDTPQAAQNVAQADGGWGEPVSQDCYGHYSVRASSPIQNGHRDSSTVLQLPVKAVGVPGATPLDSHSHVTHFAPHSAAPAPYTYSDDARPAPDILTAPDWNDFPHSYAPRNDLVGQRTDWGTPSREPPRGPLAASFKPSRAPPLENSRSSGRSNQRQPEHDNRGPPPVIANGRTMSIAGRASSIGMISPRLSCRQTQSHHPPRTQNGENSHSPASDTFTYPGVKSSANHQPDVESGHQRYGTNQDSGWGDITARVISHHQGRPLQPGWGDTPNSAVSRNSEHLAPSPMSAVVALAFEQSEKAVIDGSKCRPTKSPEGLKGSTASRWSTSRLSTHEDYRWPSHGDIEKPRPYAGDEFDLLQGPLAGPSHESSARHLFSANPTQSRDDAQTESCAELSESSAQLPMTAQKDDRHFRQDARVTGDHSKHSFTPPAASSGWDPVEEITSEMSDTHIDTSGTVSVSPSTPRGVTIGGGVWGTSGPVKAEEQPHTAQLHQFSADLVTSNGWGGMPAAPASKVQQSAPSAGSGWDTPAAASAPISSNDFGWDTPAAASATTSSNDFGWGTSVPTPSDNNSDIGNRNFHYSGNNPNLAGEANGCCNAPGQNGKSAHHDAANDRTGQHRAFADSRMGSGRGMWVGRDQGWGSRAPGGGNDLGNPQQRGRASMNGEATAWPARTSRNDDSARYFRPLYAIRAADSGGHFPSHQAGAPYGETYATNANAMPLGINRWKRNAESVLGGSQVGSVNGYGPPKGHIPHISGSGW